MNKRELVEIISADAEVSKAKAQAGLDIILKNVQESLKSGDGVQLIGFGSFQLVDRAERNGVNPRNGEPLRIPARKVVTFKAGKALQSSVQSDI